MKFKLSMSIASLILLGCGAKPFDEDIQLDIDLLASEDGVHRSALVNEALDIWSRTFPGCQHRIGRVTDVGYDAVDALVFVDRPNLDVYHVDGHEFERVAMYVPNVPNILLTAGVFDDVEGGGVGSIRIILHELGHSHGISGHADDGIMYTAASHYHADGTSVDGTMYEMVCRSDARCCSR